MCKNIMHAMLEMRDEHSTSLPFACLVTKICLRSVTNIPDTKPKVKVQDPLGSQTLMKVKAKHISLLQFKLISMQLPPHLILLHVLHLMMLLFHRLWRHWVLFKKWSALLVNEFI
jgi:hypothetical protein